ncbi:MAG: CRISPR-associated endoribonuclease Cas6 [Candidatus Altiarchaeum hamiconexum]|uniref:CRISPR-associated endoribonuclease Cas6 n=1 Tax=Candidatus Altarchaeum hamiconexum TaxID=1803513 RepID=A0A8J7YQV8_9ARCH|nr:CRISPR-associated endoribonuclease Cas6 [Candidatus Altarchaeum hamiconexum]OIQ05920.1 MAG: CRISPR-associated endoribonuclease Cas6 [Candidatus Altarchaeum sp. CG2_30_32_3053]PIN67633.1 MAG: CRISPR-associated endoribonuclease Cas6 [Candidatus Altarchaeum sp. CG12_big_fil_rev_8_21_14_0_65_33_22]PIV27349.1 MAG: CRISPR-associated endoribonuclease Cas6 [Candidatus Altarchaeum sp. CG03_land_8_20_14_0_80_32_618]PIX48719.1 MAG: CRISPR-associated endoribonuclease Cas6 [Candidatus Altarchaeum sp. CG_
MRLLIKLRNAKEQAYDLNYYHKLQGFIYSLLKDTSYSELHNHKGYKFFSFSNIFPMKTKKHDERNLMIASPSGKFIDVFLGKISERKDNLLHIGEYELELRGIKKIKPKIENKCTLITGTPIVIRIPKENYEKYDIDEEHDSAFWKKKHSFEAFIKQLESNLFKKYNVFYNTKINEIPIFEQFIFKKPTVNHVIKGGMEHKVFGSILEFNFNYLNDSQIKILEFGIDTGFGEMNSLGFGFMNVKK